MTGAIGPSSLVSPQESEFSAPGGVDAEDIVAYRALHPQVPDIEDIEDDIPELSFSGSSIYISEQFIKDYPDRVSDLVDSLLQKNERCVDKESVIKSITQPVSTSTSDFSSHKIG